MNDDGNDAVSFDDYCTFRVELPVTDIDHGGVGDRECLRKRAGTGNQEKRG